MLKRLSTDFSLWFLVIFNLYLIWYYGQHHDSFITLVWLYWLQSVMIGLFHALDIFTLRNPDTPKHDVNETQPAGPLRSNGCLGLFFLVHYGGFHLAYAVFLLIQVRGTFDINLLKLGAALIFIELTLSFIKRKIQEKRNPDAVVGNMFALPYLRIIPMHLMILGPAFLGWSNVSIFLWLKTFTDVLMYIFINRPRQVATAVS